MVSNDRRILLAALALHIIVLFFAMPASPWEFDEPLFFQGLHDYNPVAHHPPPPGYPLFMAVGHVVRAIIPSDFLALRTISFAGSAIGFVLLALAFGNLTGNRIAGVAGAVLFYFSPALLVHSTLPISEGGAVALLAAALYFASGARVSSPALFAAFCALTIGWRIQFTIFVLPLFFTALFLMSSWRDRLRVLATFTLVCLLWFVPLAAAVGGPLELYRFETGQAGYLVEHDADVSRSGWTPPQLVLRFVAHPWGTKLASFPVLLVAAIGVMAFLRERRREVIPLAVAAAIYIAFVLAVMDPADGVRYAIPFVLFTACAAGAGMVWLAPRIRVPVAAALALFACASLVYVSSLLSQRSSTLSPPVRAAEFARRTYPANAIAVYELPLWPHATYLLRKYNPVRVDEGLARAYERPDVPMFLYADGAARGTEAATFRWEPSDAYSKLTRNHYRLSSIVPIRPEERFRAIRGIYGWEREPDGLAWRWLAPLAEMKLPRGPAGQAMVRAGLPENAPIDANALSVFIDGSPAGTFRVERGRQTVIAVAVPAGAPVLRFVAAQSFVPAQIAGSLNRDPRTLAVKMYGMTTRRSAAAGAERRAASQ